MTGLLLFLEAVVDIFTSMAQLLLHQPSAMATVLTIYFLLELPMILLVRGGLVLWWVVQKKQKPPARHFPVVSCIITCYGEGRDVEQTLLTLCEQTYPGQMELIPVVDGASQNIETYQAVLGFRKHMKRYPNRILQMLPKWQRGGRVSSLNAGLNLAKGEIVMALDGDTSFDNDMVMRAVPHFRNPATQAVAGALRVRNLNDSITTRMQGIEYLNALQAGKAGLSQLGITNNVSGAFGIFRKQFLKKIGGWDTHTAEDLDLTLRIKSYCTRVPGLRIDCEPHAVGHTDAPSTFRELLKQRLRWEGDLYFLYVRKHRYNFQLRLMGSRFFLFEILSGIFVGIIMPVVALIYTCALLLLYPLVLTAGIFAVLYLAYLMTSVVNYLSSLLLVSERKREDLSLFPWLALYPAYAFIMRLWSGVAILVEMFCRSHEESSMAPWWVLKRANRF